MSDTPPDGALGMSERGDMLPADVPDEPDRDIDGLTETFETVESGDTLKLGIAVELDGELTGGRCTRRSAASSATWRASTFE